MFRREKKVVLPAAAEALLGREQAMAISGVHFVHQNLIKPPFAVGLQTALFGLGCFWGAERVFWQLQGVYTTAVGYAGGFTPNPVYEEVCSGRTGHNEVVLVVFDTECIEYTQLLKTFWERHDPTQGMRQGNDVGTQYRSGIYTYSDAQQQQALVSMQRYQILLMEDNRNSIRTEIIPAPNFYYAEEYHQQYLAKNPDGYCGLGGTGVCFSD